MAKYELIMGCILNLIEKAENAFIKYFPTAAVLIAVLFTVGVAGGVEHGHVTTADAPTLIIIALSFTVVCLIWAIKKTKQETK